MGRTIASGIELGYNKCFDGAAANVKLSILHYGSILTPGECQEGQGWRRSREALGVKPPKSFDLFATTSPHRVPIILLFDAGPIQL